MPERIQRLDWLASIRLQIADVVVAARQAASEVGDGGVVVGQLLLDRHRAAGRTPAPSAGLPVCDCRKPMLLWVFASWFLKLGDGGVVVGQLLPDRQRRRYDSSASTGLPVPDCRIADDVVGVHQVASEFGDGGVVVGQPRQGLHRPLVGRRRLGRLPRSPSSTPMPA